MFLKHFTTFAHVNMLIKMKKNYLLWAVTALIMLALQSCNNGKTYAEMKEEEADAINKYILENDIKVISEADFAAQDSTTKENEYVLSAPKKIIRKLINKKIDIEIKSNENLKTANHIIGAGPYLVKDSEIYVDYKEQKLQAISGKNPRSAVGFKNNGTFIIVTVDGREKDSVGMTLFELAKLMKNLGCNYAMNFDGGSSSALYVKGKIVNSAINKEGIAVSNALTISEFNPYQMQLTSIKNSEEVL